MNMLEQSIKVNGLNIHNRLVMAPMECRKTDERGEVSAEMLDYYDVRSKGGDFGLIVTEHHFVSPEGRASSKQLSIVDDAKIEGNRALAELAHENGSAIFMQLGHAGMIAKPLAGEGEPLSADDVSRPSLMGGTINARAMTREDIECVTRRFADGAARAKEADFDGVEVHAAHGYLLSQFYSPLTNHRTDEYAGNMLEGRLRFHVEVIRAIRDAVGDDFPISVRFGAYDYQDGGSKLEEIPTAARWLEEAGVDILSISMGMGGGEVLKQPVEGVFSDLAAIAKEAVDIPVITVGNIRTRHGAEKLLQDGKADLVAIGRPIFKDPDFARKMMRG